MQGSVDPLRFLEQIARISALPESSGDERFSPESIEHPFDARNIHPRLPLVVRTLFDSGHFAQATFEAAKFMENEVKRWARTTKTGKDLMMQAFSESAPMIQLTPLSTVSERDEQEGFKFIFAGLVLAIRNPRGHDHVSDSPEKCLDHLSIVSLLMRRLDEAIGTVTGGPS